MSNYILDINNISFKKNYIKYVLIELCARSLYDIPDNLQDILFYLFSIDFIKTVSIAVSIRDMYDVVFPHYVLICAVRYRKLYIGYADLYITRYLSYAISSCSKTPNDIWWQAKLWNGSIPNILRKAWARNSFSYKKTMKIIHSKYIKSTYTLPKFNDKCLSLTQCSVPSIVTSIVMSFQCEQSSICLFDNNCRYINFPHKMPLKNTIDSVLSNFNKSSTHDQPGLLYFFAEAFIWKKMNYTELSENSPFYFDTIYIHCEYDTYVHDVWNELYMNCNLDFSCIGIPFGSSEYNIFDLIKRYHSNVNPFCNFYLIQYHSPYNKTFVDDRIFFIYCDEVDDRLLFYSKMMSSVAHEFGIKFNHVK